MQLWKNYKKVEKGKYPLSFKFMVESTGCGATWFAIVEKEGRLFQATLQPTLAHYTAVQLGGFKIERWYSCSQIHNCVKAMRIRFPEK